MPQATWADSVNELIVKTNTYIPRTTTYFAGSQAVARMSNGQGRPSKLWTRANSGMDMVLLRTISWVGYLTGWHVDHIDPVIKGGTYNVNNVRLLPPGLNAFISGSGNWPHEKLNDLINHLGPQWRKEIGVPEGFKSMPAQEFLESDFLKQYMRHLNKKA